MVRPKKYLGQHFLRDQAIALKIVESLTGFGDYQQVLEIGPGYRYINQTPPAKAGMEYLDDRC